MSFPTQLVKLFYINLKLLTICKVDVVVSLRSEQYQTFSVYVFLLILLTFTDI